MSFIIERELKERRAQLASKTALESVQEIDEWTKVTDDIVMFRSDMNLMSIAYIAPHPNATLISSNGEATLIDTGFETEDAKVIREYIKEHNLQLKNIIFTHIHPDHTGGFPLLREENTKIYTPHPPYNYHAKDNRKPLYGEENMNILTSKDIGDGYTIKMGNKTLRIIHTPGHSLNNHVSVEVVEDNILIAGDVIVTNSLPNINYHGDFYALLDTLTELESKNYKLIIPGHGKIISTEEAFSRQFNYLRNSEKILNKILNTDGGFKDIEKIELTDILDDISYLDEKDWELWNTKTLLAIYVQMKEKSMNK